jgi:hypothetical protein
MARETGKQVLGEQAAAVTFFVIQDEDTILVDFK